MISTCVLDELKDRLAFAYGERLHAVVLFGSEARGDARPDSDIDVLAVLKTLSGDYGDEGVANGIDVSGLGSRHRSTRPAPNLLASLTGNTLNECPQCYESVVIGFTFTRMRAPSLLTFTFAAQMESASSGWTRLLWPETVAFLPTP